MDRRQQIIGKDEALFRAVNERIEEVSRRVPDQETAAFLCECGDPDCGAHIELTSAEYEEIRADPTLFAFAKGHEAPDIEEIVAEREGYAVARKRPGVPERLARQTDPRS
jgi:hypothetical protein